MTFDHRIKNWASPQGWPNPYLKGCCVGDQEVRDHASGA